MRSLGRNSSGVKGIKLVGDDTVVGMVVCNPEATLLTVCEKGYGKRTPFGPGAAVDETDETTSDENGGEAETASKTRIVSRFVARVHVNRAWSTWRLGREVGVIASRWGIRVRGFSDGIHGVDRRR